MPKKRTSRIFRRPGRLYGDFRDYAAYGGKQEPLRPDGEPYATKDVDVATRLASRRLEELEELRRGSQILDRSGGTKLAEYVKRHLALKEEEGTTKRHLDVVNGQLRAAVDYYGVGRDISTIKTTEIGDWLRTLKTRSNGRGGTLTNATVRST